MKTKQAETEIARHRAEARKIVDEIRDELAKADLTPQRRKALSERLDQHIKVMSIQVASLNHAEVKKKK